jgi:hypothetical protein
MRYGSERGIPAMTIFAKTLAAAALAGAVAVPAAGQYYPPPYQQPYPQPYPQQPYPQQYPYPGYPQNQSVIGQIIDGLIGNRYNVTDRQAIRSCGYAAMQRAEQQYGGYGYNGQYPQAWQGNRYPGYMRIVGINDVERRSGGLRVRGLIDSGRYRNRGYGGDLTFRCDVNYNGYVTRIRIERNY